MGNIKILNIVQDSIVDGVGLRATIFFAGCPHRCKGCHNPESWNIEYGVDYSVEEIMSEIRTNKITKGVTLSGGDPFFQAKEIAPLAKQIKKEGYNLWAYTGYLFEDILNDVNQMELLSFIDVLVDGKFEIENKDLTLAFRGSSNQRIINVQQSLEENSVILCIN